MTEGMVALTPGKKAWATRKKNENRRNASLKAWDTRKDVEIDVSVFKDFNLPRKNEMRNKLVEIIKENYHYKYPKNILALESPQCLFSSKLPQFNIIAYEHDEETYRAIDAKKPENLTVYSGDIADAFYSDMKYYACFLDFCNTINSNVDRIRKMQHILWNSKIVAFTFSVRGYKKDLPNHESDIIRRLQNMLPSHLLIYAKTYSDGSPMIFIILKRNPEVKHRKNRTGAFS